MAMKEYSTFPKAPGLEPRNQMLYTIKSRTRVEGSYPSTEMQSAYSTAPADWAVDKVRYQCFYFFRNLYNSLIAPIFVQYLWAAFLIILMNIAV